MAFSNEFSEVFGDVEIDERIERDAKLVYSGRKLERDETLDMLDGMGMEENYKELEQTKLMDLYFAKGFNKAVKLIKDQLSNHKYD